MNELIQDTGYILQVVLEYPKELHNLHNDYPLAPDNITINRVDKLTPKLNNKTKYIFHLKNLQLYLSLGMKLTKIHKALQFTQKELMKPYIDLNTNLRTKSKTTLKRLFQTYE